MNDNTPIPLRAHRKKASKPIEFPTPDLADDVAPHPEPRTARLQLPERLKPHLRMDMDTGEVVSRFDEEKLRAFVEACVHQALREHDARLVRTLHKAVMDWPIAEIMTMGEAQFEALCRSILEDEA